MTQRLAVGSRAPWMEESAVPWILSVERQRRINDPVMFTLRPGMQLIVDGRLLRFSLIFDKRSVGEDSCLVGGFKVQVTNKLLVWHAGMPILL